MQAKSLISLSSPYSPPRIGRTLFGTAKPNDLKGFRGVVQAFRNASDRNETGQRALDPWKTRGICSRHVRRGA